MEKPRSEAVRTGQGHRGAGSEGAEEGPLWGPGPGGGGGAGGAETAELLIKSYHRRKRKVRLAD